MSGFNIKQEFVGSLGGSVSSAEIDDDSIVDADVNSAAAITLSKLAALTASELVISDGSGFLASAAVATYPSLTELTYLKGVTSSIQTQIDGVSVSMQDAYDGGNSITLDGTNAFLIGENGSTEGGSLAFQDTSVAHGMTTLAPTNVYGRFAIEDLSRGGLKIDSFSDAANGGEMILHPRIGANPVVTPLLFRAGKTTGTTAENLADAEEFAEFQKNDGTTLITVFGNGDMVLADAASLTLHSTGASVDTILDEDDMTSDDPNALATQQSIKAYVDASGGASPQLIQSMNFETSARYTQASTNGSVTFGSYGISVDTSATQAGYAECQMDNRATFAYFYSNDYSFSSWAELYSTTAGTDFEVHLGVGEVTTSGTSITYTPKHTGFSMKRASSGTPVIYATNANGTTETATALSQVPAAGASFVYTVDYTAGSSIKFYTGGNDADFTLGATHTTNLPTGAEDFPFQLSGTNMNVATQTRFYCSAASFSMGATT